MAPYLKITGTQWVSQRTLSLQASTGDSYFSAGVWRQYHNRHSMTRDFVFSWLNRFISCYYTRVQKHDFLTPTCLKDCAQLYLWALYPGTWQSNLTNLLGLKLITAVGAVSWVKVWRADNRSRKWTHDLLAIPANSFKELSLLLPVRDFLINCWKRFYRYVYEPISNCGTLTSACISCEEQVASVVTFLLRGWHWALLKRLSGSPFANLMVK